MMASLNTAGWTASEPDDADLIIINSCGFIESAKRESINAVLAWRKQYPDKKILLAGCLSQRYGDELKEALPEADRMFGNSDLAGIAAAAAAATSATATAPTPVIKTGERPLLSLPGSAYVKISEGCDNRCSYCAIPLIRGNLKSRDISDIADECKALLGRGIRELCIVGQDIGSYGNDKSCVNLPKLLQKISRLKGNFWVRLLYIHPDHFPFPVLDLMKEDGRFLHYFDLPFQHGSEKILRLMNRKGSASQYLDLVGTIRKCFPDSVIRSTFLTGFPGETEDDFRALLDFQEKACLDWAGCFAYSREEDTPAWSMKPRVSKKTALERKKIIEERQVQITEKRMDRFIGMEFDALAEEKVEGEELWLGRLPFQAPEVDGAAVIETDGDLQPGCFFRGKVFARAGLDLRVVPV